MNAVIDAAIGRSRTVLMALALILAAGTVAYISIPKESEPDINIPIIYVGMSHDGISPEDGERLLVRPMEQELRSIEGIKEMRSTATEGYANVLLEFDAGFDADRALADVRERVDIAKTDLPDETDEPTVNEVNVSLFPVIVIMLSGEMPERTLLRLARDLQDVLEGLPGVLAANIVGNREELLEVVVDPVRLESYGITQAELIRAVDFNNRLVAAGALDTGAGRFSVKVPGLFESAADVLEIPVKTNGDAVVTLAEVTELRRTFWDATSFARFNGRPTIALEVQKRIGFNVIDTIDEVRAAVAEERGRWPSTVDVTFIQDQSEFIDTMLTDLQNNVISAVLLVMIVVLAALGLRSAGLVGMAIPGSFLIGILFLNLFGMTINIVVLFSLILAVGMLVDGAIVVTEFADRKMAEGRHRREAYAAAAKRMAWPIAASTLTTLAAFMPLLFWPGVVGEFMKFLPITLIVTLSGSLLMALLFVPTLGSIFGRVGTSNERTLKRLAATEIGEIADIDGFTGVYARGLRLLVRRGFGAFAVVASAVLLLIGAQAAYGKFGAGVEFFPEVDQDSAFVLVHARGNLSSAEKDTLMSEVERRVMQLDEFDAVYTQTGFSGAGQDQAEDVIGRIMLEFKPWRERRPGTAILADLRRRTADIPGIVVEMRKPDTGPPTGKDIRIELASRSPELLPPVVQLVRDSLDRNVAGLIDVEDSRPIPGIEWQIEVDRAQAGRFASNVFDVGNLIQFVTNGVKVGAYRPDDSDEEIQIRARFPDDERSITQLDTLSVQTPNGLVPISNFVKRVPRPKVGKIDRIDGLRVLTVQANVAEGVLVDDKVREIGALLAAAPIPPGVDWSFKGQDQEQREAQDFLTRAFAVALFIMAIILVTQFNSFYHAFLVLTAVIMSTIGVMIGLLVTGQPFGIVMTGIGVITLAGVVVNNNIVLIDTFVRLRKTGMDGIEAVVRTGAQRLRPVLLTAITTVFGLLPMVLSMNVDFLAPEIAFGAPSTQWWVQLSTAVVSGLTFATVLTLAVTPSLLALQVHARRSLDNVRRRRLARRAAAADAQPAG